jgi:hypothetical protein
MRFFRRDDGPADFWSWWADGRDRVAAAIAGGGFDEGLVDDISRAVRTIDPAMAWELAPGRAAEHAFCISPEGNPELRQAALRWLATAPPADSKWEYHASRQPSPALQSLEVGGFRVELGEMRAISSWDASRRRVDVRLWHPMFPQLPDPVRLQVGFLFLDNLLGEDDVERWVGQIDLLEAPTGGRTPDELRAEILRRRDEPGGDETWVLATRGDPGRETIVLANAALKRIDHPWADHHAEIGVVLDGPGGLPDDAEAAALNAEEDDLIGRLEDVAVYAGRQTTPGLRAMHFVAQDPEAMKPAIDAWAETLPPRRIKVNFQHDVGWEFQRDLGVR